MAHRARRISKEYSDESIEGRGGALMPEVIEGRLERRRRISAEYAIDEAISENPDGSDGMVVRRARKMSREQLFTTAATSSSSSRETSPKSLNASPRGMASPMMNDTAMGSPVLGGNRQGLSILRRLHTLRVLNEQRRDKRTKSAENDGRQRRRKAVPFHTLPVTS